MASKLHRLVQEGGGGGGKGGGGGRSTTKPKTKTQKKKLAAVAGAARQREKEQREGGRSTGLVAQLAQGVGVEEETVEALGYAVAAAAAAYSVWRRVRG